MHRRNKNVIPIIVVSAVVIGGVALYAYEHSQTHRPDQSNTPPQPSTPSNTIPQKAGAKCVMRGVLPDAKCTPGAIDTSITQANITSTICVRGYTKTVRPSVSYTNRIKAEQMTEYGFTDSIHAHEEDHLISLELGGSPDNPLNLWPEPGGSPNAKDKVENYLHAAVCAGRIGLHEAQVRIATNWTTAENGL